MVAIEVLKEDEGILKDFADKHPKECELIQSKKFQGQAETVQVLITISATVLPFVAKIIIEYIRAKKHVSLKYKGVEVKGISEKNIVEILEKLKE